MALLERLFGRGQPDGGSAVLEAEVTGFTPAGLSALAEGQAPALVGRRERSVGGGHDTLNEVLGQKVMHGWLQNRHQTLYPLTVNFRTMAPDQVSALAAMMAVAASASRTATPTEDAVGWFVQAGGDATVIRQALQAPPPLHLALAAVMAENVAAYGYVLTLVALDRQDPASPHFLSYVAAWLALPSTVVRSANRRYRR